MLFCVPLFRSFLWQSPMPLEGNTARVEYLRIHEAKALVGCAKAMRILTASVYCGVRRNARISRQSLPNPRSALLIDAGCFRSPQPVLRE